MMSQEENVELRENEQQQQQQFYENIVEQRQQDDYDEIDYCCDQSVVDSSLVVTTAAAANAASHQPTIAPAAAPVFTHSFQRDLVFDPKSQSERTPWTIFGHDCSRSLMLFVFQYIIVCTLVISSIICLIVSKSCEETTVWVGILGSAVGYILPCPSLSSP